MSNPSTDASPTALDTAALTLLDNPLVAMAIEYGVIVVMLVCTLVVGWILSGRCGRAAARLIDRLGLEVLAEKLGAARLLYKIGMRGGVAKLGGKIVRGFGLLLTAYVTIAQLRIEALTEALTHVLGYVPTVLTACVIAAGGVWLSERVKQLVLGDEEPGSTRRFLASMASIATLVMALTMALEQLGVQMDLLHDILLAVYGVAVCCIGAMFALGARSSMSQLIAGHYGRKMLRVGDRIRLHDEPQEYEVTSFGPLHVIARRDIHSEALIPYTRFMEQSVRVMYTTPVTTSPEEGAQGNGAP